MKKFNFKAEDYKCAAISTGVLNHSDCNILRGDNSGMCMERDTGWFLKLYDETSLVLDQLCGMSGGAREMILAAHSEGYRLIEFDADAYFPEKIKRYSAVVTEVNQYTIEVEAKSEEDAENIAHDKIVESANRDEWFTCCKDRQSKATEI
jgi:hypothetical protein